MSNVGHAQPVPRSRTEPLDASERRQLCDLLAELGPDAPTLCEGWTTADLAAHLVLREHFHRWGARRLAAAKARGFPALVRRLRRGAPLFPWRLPGARTLLNGFEFFIHHEDVRRANGRPPRSVPELEALSWRMTGYLGRRLARRIRPHGLVLVAADGRRRSFGRGRAATLSGSPTELAVYLSGRRSAAQVTLSGSDEAIAAVRGTAVRL
ncbi:MAG TPA: maleylpyruvate isomerase family mycothiol-dependent enzyme [Candidatus Binatia bacterium]|nr:maleylpyruvate isomerase family mycothiol-dependent enzyme [Candidatus Binatia bacterium]